MTDQTSSYWEQVGEVGVDAGLIWLGDPCYIIGKEADHRWDEWSDFCNDMDQDNWPDTKQFNFRMGHAGLGVTVSTGYGDGLYPVEVKRTSKGRIAEVRLVFIEEEDED